VIRPFFLLVAATLLAVGLAATGAAHNVQVFAYLDGQTIRGEATVGGGKKAKNADILILDPDDKTTLARTKTDDDGSFSIALNETGRPQTGPLLVVLEAGPGHRAEWLLQTVAESAASSPQALVNKPPTNGKTLETNSPPINTDELRRLIGEVVEEKLVPVKQMIAQQQASAPGLKDILGGLGFIVGIGGIIAYTVSRKRNKKN
jgi:nickel transport protein